MDTPKPTSIRRVQYRALAVCTARSKSRNHNTYERNRYDAHEQRGIGGDFFLHGKEPLPKEKERRAGSANTIKRENQ